MATYTSGGQRKATANSVTAAQNSAEKRRCPKCGRKSAIKHMSDELMFGAYCRYDDCGYESITMREWEE